MRYPAAVRVAQDLTRQLTTIPPLRSFLALCLALAVFGLLLLALGRNPAEALTGVISGTLGSRVGLSEVGVLMIPLVLTGLATAVPARVGLINVGGEGQLYLGAWAATGVALYLGAGQGWMMLPVMAAAGCAAGGAWAGVAVALRHLRGVNEIITTLLANYAAILVVNVFVFGPWKDPGGFGYPYTPPFDPAAIFSSIGATRLHLGLVMPVLAVILCYLVMYRTRWGFNMRAVGGNADAARRLGIPVFRYLMAAMIVGGGIAGLAGVAEVAGVQHHLRPGIANNLGYLGFLASWLTGHNPLAVVAASLLIAVILVGGNVLQFSENLPAAASLILIGLVLFFTLGLRSRA